MASSSHSGPSTEGNSPNFPPEMSIVSTLDNAGCTEKMLEEQYFAYQYWGDTFVMPSMFHPETPFMHYFRLPSGGQFSGNTLSMLWYLCYMHYIPFEFHLEEWCNCLILGHVLDDVQTFLKWFMPIQEWVDLFSKLLYTTQRGNIPKNKFNSIIFLKWTESTKSHEIFQTYLFSIVDNWDKQHREVQKLQRRSAYKNEYMEGQNYRGNRNDAPWKNLPTQYVETIQWRKEIYGMLNESGIFLGVDEFHRRNEPEDDEDLVDYENMNLSPSHEPINRRD